MVQESMNSRKVLYIDLELFSNKKMKCGVNEFV